MALTRRVSTVVIMVAAAGVLLSGIGVYVWRVRPLPVDTVAARTGLAMDAVYASGIVDYERQANIAAVVSAPIVAVVVAEGEAVTEGQTLARLEDGPQAAAAAQLETQAALSRAVASRATRLAAAGYGPRAVAEDAQAQRRAAEAAARSAAAALRFYRVRAPFSGVIIRRDAEVGNLATPSTVLFTIAAPDTLRVTAEVDERDIEGLTPGRLALVSADGLPGQVIRGRVDAVTPAGDPEARVFRVRVALPPGSPLRPGMTVDVNIVIATRSSAVLIPAAAVQDGRAWVAASGRAEPRSLKTGARDAGSVEVVAGVRAGERVIVNPPAGLRAGRAVRAGEP
ncbi:Macrolide export protein MacA [compost metagenome]